jgi:diadenosine tetraphosphate (Ap4A) HIT family hydrolase
MVSEMRHSSPASTCFLCDIVERGVGKPMRSLFPRGPLENESLAATSRYAMILDVAPIVEGHSLVIPKRHVTSFAAEPQEAAGELAAFVDRCEDAVRRAYGVEPLVFEHGSVTDEARSGCCITHAHLHIVPLNAHLLRPDERDSFQDLREFVDLLRLKPNRDYLLYKGRDRRYRLSTTANVESQHFRRRMAEAVGEDLWNWLDLVLLSNANDTRKRLVDGRAKLRKALEQ